MQEKPQASGLQTPSPERKEKIDRDEIEPDPLRDKMSHEDWRKRDTFGHKVSASIRRTGADIKKALEKEQEQEKGAQAPGKQESDQQKSWREEIQKSRGQSGTEKDRGRE